MPPGKHPATHTPPDSTKSIGFMTPTASSLARARSRVDRSESYGEHALLSTPKSGSGISHSVPGNPAKAKVLNGVRDVARMNKVVGAFAQNKGDEFSGTGDEVAVVDDEEVEEKEKERNVDERPPWHPIWNREVSPVYGDGQSDNGEGWGGLRLRTLSEPNVSRGGRMLREPETNSKGSQSSAGQMYRRHSTRGTRQGRGRARFREDLGTFHEEGLRYQEWLDGHLAHRRGLKDQHARLIIEVDIPLGEALDTHDPGKTPVPTPDGKSEYRSDSESQHVKSTVDLLLGETLDSLKRRKTPVTALEDLAVWIGKVDKKMPTCSGEAENSEDRAPLHTLEELEMLIGKVGEPNETIVVTNDGFWGHIVKTYGSFMSAGDTSQSSRHTSEKIDLAPAIEPTKENMHHTTTNCGVDANGKTVANSKDRLQMPDNELFALKMAIESMQSDIEAMRDALNKDKALIKGPPEILRVEKNDPEQIRVLRGLMNDLIGAYLGSYDRSLEEHSALERTLERTTDELQVARRENGKIQEEKENQEKLCEETTSTLDMAKRMIAEYAKQHSKEVNEEMVERVEQRKEDETWKEVYLVEKRLHAASRREFEELQDQARRNYKSELEREHKEYRERLSKCEDHAVVLNDEATAYKEKAIQWEHEYVNTKAELEKYRENTDEIISSLQAEMEGYIQDYQAKLPKNDTSWYKIEPLQNIVKALERYRAEYHEHLGQVKEEREVAHRKIEDLMEETEQLKRELILPHSPSQDHGLLYRPMAIPGYRTEDGQAAIGRAMEKFREKQRRTSRDRDIAGNLLEQVRKWRMGEHYPPLKPEWTQMKEKSAWERWGGDEWLIYAGDGDGAEARRLKKAGLLLR